MGKGNDDIKLKKKHLRKIGAFKRQAAFFAFWENIFTAFANVPVFDATVTAFDIVSFLFPLLSVVSTCK